MTVTVTVPVMALRFKSDPHWHWHWQPGLMSLRAARASESEPDRRRRGARLLLPVSLRRRPGAAATVTRRSALASTAAHSSIWILDRSDNFCIACDIALHAILYAISHAI